MNSKPIIRPSAEFVCKAPDEIVGICTFKGRVIIATKRRVYELRDDKKLHLLKVSAA